jgi:hypothetical protein
MLSAIKQKVAEALPESTVLNLVQLRHGEKPWQVAAKTRARVALDRPPLDESAGRRGLRAKVVTEFDVHAEREENFRAVGEALDRAGIRYVRVPGARGTARCFAVSSEDRERANAALLAALTEPYWGVHKMVGETAGTVTLLAGIHRLDEKGLRAVAGADAIEVFRLIAAPTGRTLCGAEQACIVDFWTREASGKVSRPDGGKYEVGTRIARRRNGYVDYLSPASWEEAIESPTHWPQSAALPLFTDVRDPIDIVYTWVDGDDPAWLARKSVYATDSVAAELNSSAVHLSRYVSRDELRYSLRSVAMYAGWVRRIYLVTDQQVPSWLNTAHPKIQVVDHKEIFSDTSALPVYNSHAIESQLHHIEGLSERYLYLNDDVFFGRAVQPELFFYGNGLAKFFLSKTPLDIDPPSSRDLPVMSAAKHNRELIEQQFGVTITNKFKHCPIPQLRSVLVELEERYPEHFDRVSRSRFRHPDDLSITSALHHYYAFCKGLAVPGTIRYVYQDIAREDTPRRLINLLRERDTDVFCLNDHETPESDMATQQRILAEFLQAQFPIPSPFEL